MLTGSSNSTSYAEESRKVKVQILLDPESQRNDITEYLASVLKTFSDQNAKPRNVNKYTCCIAGEFGMNLYVSALAVSGICSYISGQRIDVIMNDFSGLRGVNIDASDIGDFDMLIGSDYHRTIVNDKVCCSEKNGLVEISLKLGWIFSGLLNDYRNNIHHEITAADLVTHIMRVELQEYNLSEIRMNPDRFWELDSLGIVEHETSVYDKFVEQIELKDDQYQVRLPFKENHTFIEDNI